MVEIDILAVCRHKNIVGLFEAFFYDAALWVRKFTVEGRASGFYFNADWKLEALY